MNPRKAPKTAPHPYQSLSQSRCVIPFHIYYLQHVSHTLPFHITFSYATLISRPAPAFAFRLVGGNSASSAPPLSDKATTASGTGGNPADVWEFTEGDLDNVGSGPAAYGSDDEWSYTSVRVSGHHLIKTLT